MGEGISRRVDAAPFVFLCHAGKSSFWPVSSRAKGGQARWRMFPLFCTFRVAAHCSSEYVRRAETRNQVRGWGLARLTRKIEIIEQFRRSVGDDICPRPPGRHIDPNLSIARENAATTCFHLATSDLCQKFPVWSLVRSKHFVVTHFGWLWRLVRGALIVG